MTEKTTAISVGTESTITVRFGGDGPFGLIAGPCVLEDRDHSMRHGEALAKISRTLALPLVFKASFDKANRSSIHSYRGPGIEDGLSWLADVRKECGLPILTDIHEAEQARIAGEVVDILQIPAFLCRQTDLLLAAAKTGKVVNVKKGQFLAGADMRHAIEKLSEAGHDKVLLTERGTCFGYHDLVVDFRGIVEMKKLGAPVIFDATHSVQRPGGAGDKSGGNREMVRPLARAAVGLGVDGLFFEVHENPDRAPSDGPNMIPLDKFEALLRELLDLADRARG